MTKKKVTKKKQGDISGKPHIMRRSRSRIGFHIAISDGFCEYTFRFSPPEKGNLSIEQIWNRIVKEFKCKKTDGYLTWLRDGV